MVFRATYRELVKRYESTDCGLERRNIVDRLVSERKLSMLSSIQRQARGDLLGSKKYYAQFLAVSNSLQTITNDSKYMFGT